MAKDFSTDGQRFWPAADLEKTAILVQVADQSAITEIEAPFGRQQMLGSFYVVAEGDRSYGASQAEFEASHERIGASRWVKQASVLAYRAEEAQSVRTMLGDHEEANVNAEAGDWIVRQESGEVMVVTNCEFKRRYTPERPA